MKILLIGYGRMGRQIDALATAQGIEVADRLDRDSLRSIADFAGQPDLIAIEFTTPDQAEANAMACLLAGIPLVCGTTGWQEGLAKVKQRVIRQGGAMVYGSNFSPGVNFAFYLARQMGRFADRFPGYKASMVERHHTQKLDAPSGTAISLAEAFLSTQSHYQGWQTEDAETGEAPRLPIQVEREGAVVGYHSLTLASPLEELTLAHNALSRDAFAQGALAAGQWLAGRQGFYTMADVLGLEG